MKNSKRIITLILIMMITASTIAVSTISASSASYDDYRLEVDFADATADIIVFDVECENGTFSVWSSWGSHEAVNVDRTEVGEPKKVTIKNIGVNGCYPNYVSIKRYKTKKTTTFYGGRWVDNATPVTLATNDNVYKIDIKTADAKNAGTDSNVYFSLIDKDGNKSDKVNASSIHPKANAFERGDFATFYVHVPPYFGELDKVQFNLGIWSAASTWNLESFTVTKMSGSDIDLGVEHSVTVNEKIKHNQEKSYNC